MQKLPKPNENKYVLAAKRQNMNIAVNRCIQHIKRTGLHQYALLHFDYSGFRNTEGEKSVNVIDRVQNIMPHLLNDPENNLIVYGQTGESSRGTILFNCVEDAILFAKKIQFSVTYPEFAQVIFRFGCCFQNVSDIKNPKHDNIKEAWNSAIACSESKNAASNFIITYDTYNNLSDSIKREFAMAILEGFEGENLKYAHKDFMFWDSSKVVNYQTYTDDSVEIGL